MGVERLQDAGPLAGYLQAMWATKLDTLARLAEEAERNGNPS
ncbi:hypothetical protein ACIA98_23375 [Streptomyces sp. NPDC051366]